MDIVVGIIVLFVAGIVGYFVFGGMWESMNADWRDEDEFDRRRALRQDEFDRHQKAVIRRCLIDTCENIYIGRRDDGAKRMH